MRLHDRRHVLGGGNLFIKNLVLPSRLFGDHPHEYARTIFELFELVEDVTIVVVEGPRTDRDAELISLREAAERNHVARALIDSKEVKALEARLESIGELWRKKNPGKSVPVFRVMAMDRRDGTNMANSLISFRI